MESLLEICKKAFVGGSDYFGEEVESIRDIEYFTPLSQYLVTLKLNKGTTQIGFVPVDDHYEVWSGHKVFDIPKSEHIDKEFDNAVITSD